MGKRSHFFYFGLIFICFTLFMTIECLAQSPTVPCSGIAQWDAETTYWGDDKAVYQSKLYQAKWWTKGDIPGQSDVWELKGECNGSPGPDPNPTPTPVSCKDVLSWKVDQVYVGGDKAHHSGNLYEAKWWTKGETPGTADVWKLLGVCDPPPDPDPGPGPDPGPQPPTPWPSKVFAPYIDVCAWPEFSISDMATKSNVLYYTLAFIVSDNSGNPSWGGVISLDKNHYASEINKVRKMGGNVIVSFGGAAGQELALTNTSVATLQSKYQKVIDHYQLNWVDFDIEGGAVADKASIDRRSKAIYGLQQNNKDLIVAFCLPVLPSGLTHDGLYVLKSAKDAGVRIDVVNIMAMDYGDNAAPNPDGQMGEYAIKAAESLFSQLKNLYPGKSDAQLWKMVGITPMIGQNDVLSEVFDLQDGRQLLDFSQRKGVPLLSMWSGNRDNGSCPNNSNASPKCSGIAQQDFEFSNIFKALTSK